MKCNFTIYRFDPSVDQKASYQEYTLEAERTDKILDCLNRIRWEQDPTLAYRFSCAHGICGSDALVINGRIELACQKLVGDFKNGGHEWHPKGTPEDVRVHDFQDKTLGKAISYGVYDIVSNQGWVNVGIDHDTAQFATNSIRRWWARMGHRRFPRATELLITADGGGSNSHRSRLWKVSLQTLADDLELKLHVCLHCVL